MTANLALAKSGLRILRFAPGTLLTLIVAFVLVSATDEPWPRVRSIVLGCILVGAAVWFIACFTGDAKVKLPHVFIFAYAFTFGSFALLITPFVGSEVRMPTEKAAIPAVGVLQLVRGCIRNPAGTPAQQVSAVVACPERSTASKAQADAATPNASAGSEPELPAPAASNLPPAAAADAASPTPPAKPASASAPAPAPAASGASASTYVFTAIAKPYAWLVSIGGVTATKFDFVLHGADKRVLSSHIEVDGGLAVPLYVVVLAFIGGAISLSRRIPEYQRRAEGEYEPTAKEPALRAFQVREHVVFQIMQLTSAPFLAMATWYVVTPSSVGTAAAVAFATGFLSEYILMLMRAAIEGIRPETSRQQQPERPKTPEGQGK
jgi:hypothetical protein